MIEIMINVAGICISAFLYYFSKDFAVSTREGVPSAAFFPRIIAAILLLLSIINLVKIFVQKKKNTYKAPEATVKGRALQIIAVVALLLFYAILWKSHIGHFILNSIIVFVPICWLISDEIEWWKSLIYVVCLVIFIYLLFSVGLKVRLW